MKRLLLILLCLLMMLPTTACKKQKGDKDNKPATTTTTQAAEDPYYAADEAINRFFANFIKTYKGLYLNPATIRRAESSPDLDDVTKRYLAVINECQVTITNITGKSTPAGTPCLLSIQIEGGTTDKALDHMLGAFARIVPVVDSSCSLENATKVAELLKPMTEQTQPMNNGTRYFAMVEIANYTPIIRNAEMGITHSCRMELWVKDFAA